MQVVELFKYYRLFPSNSAQVECVTVTNYDEVLYVNRRYLSIATNQPKTQWKK